MGWGVGGWARRGKVGKEVLSRIESSAEEKLEDRRGVAGPGSQEVWTVGRWSAAGQHTAE